MAGRSGRAVSFALALLLAALGAAPARALGEEPKPGESVSQYLTPDILAMVFPGADKVGPADGAPPAAPVYKGDRLVGYLFSSWDVTQSKGFSNRPLVLLVGIDLGGHVTGVRLVHHTEPIGILGLKDEEFFRFTEHYRGLDLNQGVDIVSELSSSVLGEASFSRRAAPGTAASVKIDAVSRATTSTVLMSDAIVRGARILARSRGILAPSQAGKTRLDLDRFAPADWPALEATGAIAHLHLSYGELRDKLRDSGAVKPAAGDGAAGPADPFLDLYVALVTPAGIGINLLGETWYGEYTTDRGVDDQLVLIAAKGPFAYSVLGEDWEHADILGSIDIVQDDRTIRLSGQQIKTLPFLHAKDAPDLTERALISLDAGSNLDPGRPWTLRLLLAGETAGGERRYVSVGLSYRLPGTYILPQAAAGGAEAARPERALAWQAIWSAHWIKIAILAAGLTALTVIFSLEDRIARRRRLHRFIRIGFLSWTLIWLGWYAGAQLTVVNLLAYIHSAVVDFHWDYLLADPLIALLSVFTLAGLFLWGRAVFCGWLCPFGALQELANEMARRLRLPQLVIPAALHERLIAVKYAAFLGLAAASFLSWDLAMTGSEIEPFKAAIILRFMTAWPMAAYALALVAASLFVERFYCRFACPLGGGLAILGRLRLLNRLKRHPECGSRCRVCETLCPVGAIKRNGAIDMNECFYCLDCQVAYYDDHLCPPMVWRRKRRQEQAAAPAPARDAQGTIFREVP